MRDPENSRAAAGTEDNQHPTSGGGSSMETQAARVDNERRGDGGGGSQPSALGTQHPAGRTPAVQAMPRAKLAPARIEPAVRPGEDRWIVRFTGHQRAQHFIMMSSVLILVFTGMPQKFFDASWSPWLINFWGGLDRAQAIHHMAGFAMIFSALYHVAYVLVGVLVRKEPLPVWMLPSLKDFRDFFQNTGYYLGITKEKAKFGRFSYFEKFDYWAVFWGVPVMGITGLILMFPLLTTRFLPGVAVPVATIAHSDEALLATGWLFVVHFYNAHLAPHIFPFNKSIFTGRVAETRYKREHPLEYEERVANQEL